MSRASTKASTCRIQVIVSCVLCCFFFRTSSYHILSTQWPNIQHAHSSPNIVGWARFHGVSSQMKTFRYVYGITFGELLYWNTQTEQCSTSRCPLRKVSEWRWWIWGLYWNPGRFDQFWTQMARQEEAIDVGGYLEGKTDIPETDRTSIIKHSLMPMIPSESSIYHTNLGTTICFVPWSGYWLMPVIMRIMRRSGPGLIWTPCISPCRL